MELSNKQLNKRYPISAIIGFVDENDELQDLGLKKSESMPSRWLFAVSTNPESI